MHIHGDMENRVSVHQSDCHPLGAHFVQGVSRFYELLLPCLHYHILTFTSTRTISEQRIHKESVHSFQLNQRKLLELESRSPKPKRSKAKRIDLIWGKSDMRFRVGPPSPWPPPPPPPHLLASASACRRPPSRRIHAANSGDSQGIALPLLLLFRRRKKDPQLHALFSRQR